MFVLLNRLKNWLNVFVTESKQLLWRRKLSTDTKPVSVSGCKHDYFFKGWTWQAALASVQDADWMLLSRLISRYLSLCGAFVQSVELLDQMCSPQAAKSRTVGSKCRCWSQEIRVRSPNVLFTAHVSAIEVFFYSLFTILNFINNFSL